MKLEGDGVPRSSAIRVLVERHGLDLERTAAVINQVETDELARVL
jgi:hypothetical protein